MRFFSFYFCFVRAITSVGAKDSVYFTHKTYFFYFTLLLLQNSHINLSIIQTFFIKIIFSLTFFIITPSSFSSHYAYLYLLSISASLSSPSSSLFFFFWESFSFLFSVNTNLRQPITDLHQNRSTSTHHRFPSTPIQRFCSSGWSFLLILWLIFFFFFWVNFVVNFLFL